ncbi:MAG: type II toxin-antitoxin system HicA family toxin [Candidatus Binatia bacterium]
MARLPLCSGREAAKAFEKAGFAFDHQTGSHMIYYHSDGRHLSIPDHQELDRGLLRSLIRAAGLTVEEFAQML